MIRGLCWKDSQWFLCMKLTAEKSSKASNSSPGMEATPLAHVHTPPVVRPLATTTLEPGAADAARSLLGLSCGEMGLTSLPPSRGWTLGLLSLTQCMAEMTRWASFWVQTEETGSHPLCPLERSL